MFHIKTFGKNLIHYYLTHMVLPKSEQVRESLKEVEDKGFCVIEDFYKKERCHSLIEEIEGLFEEHSHKLWMDQSQSDKRLFGADSVSSEIKKFFDDDFINDFFNHYEKSSGKDGFVMVGKISHKGENLGSGQGWHRDRADYKQTKSIIYLSDVSSENGPFQYIEESHKPHQIVKDSMLYDKSFLQNRFTEDHVNKIIDREPERLKTLTAPAGTLVLADVRGIHRGKPIEEGSRYAMTNYTWYNMDIPSHIKALSLS